ncbi:hypothetical protein TUM12370_17670 [Salmonella enterica subsp. enterica serovar Choleraesuis]|nr:hypothetical protein TUM12370_17670 [Salmonella enterica subsp. enterica serovar Choleraesuis]
MPYRRLAEHELEPDNDALVVDEVNLKLKVKFVKLKMKLIVLFGVIKKAARLPPLKLLAQLTTF